MGVQLSIFRRGERGGQRLSKRYIIVITGSDGRRQQWTGCTDLRATQQIAAQKLRQVERGEVGLVDLQAELQQQAIQKHVDAFVADVTAGTASVGRRRRGPPTKDYVDKVRRVLKALLVDLGWRRLAEIDGAAAFRWLHGQDWADQTIGINATLLRLFGRWLVEQGAFAQDPFASLRKVPGKGRQTFTRGYLSPESLALLMATAVDRASQVRGSVRAAMLASTGRERAHCYLLAAYSGLRRREIMGLRWSDVDLGDSPAVSVRAELAKNRKAARLDLPAFVRDDLKQHRDELALVFSRPVHGDDQVFPRTSYNRVTDRMHDDLVEAGLGTWQGGRVVDQHGRVLDFHCLRVTYATHLVQSGASVTCAMTLMRHSDVRLTLQVYARVPDGALRSTVDALPQMPRLMAGSRLQHTHNAAKKA